MLLFRHLLFIYDLTPYPQSINQYPFNIKMYKSNDFIYKKKN